MPETIVIPAKYCGPPTSANGGYTAGLVADALGGTAAEVTLRRPPPLERPLLMEHRDERVVLRDGADLIAEAVPTDVDLVVPPPVSLEDAAAAGAASPVLGPIEHPFPTCFVCGPQRAEGDGLRLFAGPVRGRELVAAPWRDARPELVWAALDCPSSFVMYLADPPLPGPYVLGRLAARVDARPAPGSDAVVVAWPLGLDGRKLFSGSALFDDDGRLLAVARATWIRV